MLGIAEVSIIAVVAIVYGGFVFAAVRAFFSKAVDRVSYRIAGLWAAWLALAVIGCLMAVDMMGLSAALVWAIVVCLVAYVSSPLLMRWWRNRAVAAAVSYLQAHRVTSVPDGQVSCVKGWEALDTEYPCARAAREFGLTRREEEILQMLIEGRSFASIAGELYVSDNTVKTHVQHIYRKMGVNRKQELSERVFG